MIIRTKVLYNTSACSVFLVGSEQYYFALDVAKNKERNLGCVIYVVVQFYPWFNFYFLLFLGMVIYDNELKTKENKN